jgi:hypothetical protein
MSRQEGSGFLGRLFGRKPKNTSPTPFVAAPVGPSCDERIIKVLENEGYEKITPKVGSLYKIGAKATSSYEGSRLNKFNLVADNILGNVYKYMGKESEYIGGDFGSRIIHKFQKEGTGESIKISADEFMLKKVSAASNINKINKTNNKLALPSTLPPSAPLETVEEDPTTGGRRKTAHKKRKHSRKTRRNNRK